MSLYDCYFCETGLMPAPIFVGRQTIGTDTKPAVPTYQYTLHTYKAIGYYL